MGRIRVIAAALTVIGVLALTAPAAASPPQPVTLSVLTVLSNPSDPFTSTGGIVCSSGTVSTISALFVGGQSNQHAQIIVEKHFVCPDGTFDVLLRVTIDFSDASTAGTWSVIRGTGAYSGLHGSGTLVGTAVDPGISIQDEYSGKLHID
jgi:hypothetical protein